MNVARVRIWILARRIPLREPRTACHDESRGAGSYFHPGLVQSTSAMVRGAVEGFRKYLGPMSVAPVPTAVKATWLGAVTIPFFWSLFAPFILIYFREMRAESDSLSESLKILLGSAGYGCLMTLCGTVAVGQHLASRKCEWTGIARSEA